MFMIERDARKNVVLRQNLYRSCAGNTAEWELEYLSFPLLEETNLVSHLFTTRLGGVSKGDCSTLNLSFQRGDEEENVLTNYRRVASALGCDVEDMVASHQTHTTNIRRVTEADKGKGILRERDYTDIDGLITDEPRVALACFYADCVPLYFVDTRKRAIGLAHSGWRGTVQGMAVTMLEEMRAAFGSCPEDMRVGIGPSICRACYEVSEDVADAFRKRFDGEEVRIRQLQEVFGYAGDSVVSYGKSSGKYQLDLWLANAIWLMREGVRPEQIAVTDICTCHNPAYLFSHRASNGRRGNLGAFLMLK